MKAVALNDLSGEISAGVRILARPLIAIKIHYDDCIVGPVHTFECNGDLTELASRPPLTANVENVGATTGPVLVLIAHAVKAHDTVGPIDEA